MDATYSLDQDLTLVQDPPFRYGANPFPDEGLVRKTHALRGEFVVLENDLATLYGVDLAHLQRQVQLHARRFPDHLLFRLTTEEVKALPLSVRRSLTVDPRAFTAAGVLMLACVIGSERAVAISVRIMALFVRMRQVLINNQDLLLRLERLDQRARSSDADISGTLHDIDQLFASPSIGN